MLEKRGRCEGINKHVGDPYCSGPPSSCHQSAPQEASRVLEAIPSQYFMMFMDHMKK